MATNDEIFELRIRISDPPGFIAFEAVADSASLPSTPASQTCYKQEDTGEYKATELKSGATPSDYEVQELSISDDVLGLLIDNYGLDNATCRAIKRIISQLGSKLTIKKNDAGADSTEYQSLNDTLTYYKELLKICEDQNKSDAGTNTGRYFTSKQPEIAGGNL